MAWLYNVSIEILLRRMKTIFNKIQGCKYTYFQNLLKLLVLHHFLNSEAFSEQRPYMSWSSLLLKILRNKKQACIAKMTMIRNGFSKLSLIYLPLSSHCKSCKYKRVASSLSIFLATSFWYGSWFKSGTMLWLKKLEWKVCRAKVKPSKQANIKRDFNILRRPEMNWNSSEGRAKIRSTRVDGCVNI